MADIGLALTLWQPWASAIVNGPKRVENRPWYPPKQVVGERIWLHAGKAYDHARHAEVVKLWPELGCTCAGCSEGSLPSGAIIGSARVVGWGYSEGGFGKVSLAGAATTAVFTDPWWHGPFGWLLADVHALGKPVPCRGFQKLWRVPADVLARCQAQERGHG